jgi:hypothetical protein
MSTNDSKPQCSPDLAEKIFSQLQIDQNCNVLIKCDTGLLEHALGLIDKNHLWFIIDDIDSNYLHDCYNRDVLKPENVLIDPDYAQILSTKYIPFSGMKFDVIVGNPPFNAPHKDGKNRVETIWQKFALKAFELSNDTIAFITPATWAHGNFSKSSDTPVELKNLIFKNLTSYFDAHPFFEKKEVDGVCISAWLCSKKHSQKSEIPQLLIEKQILPRSPTSVTVFNKFFLTINNSKHIPSLYRNRQGDVSKIRGAEPPDAKHIFRLASTSAKYQNGIFDWAASAPKFYNHPKVISSYSGWARPKFFANECGNGGASIAHLVTEEQSKYLIEFLDSDFCKFLQLEYKGDYQWMPVFYVLNLPVDLLTKPWYEVFDFSQADLDHIKSIVNAH